MYDNRSVCYDSQLVKLSNSTNIHGLQCFSYKVNLALIIDPLQNRLLDTNKPQNKQESNSKIEYGW